MDRSVKSLLSIILIVAALFVAMNRVVENARLEDWWLVVVLVGLAILIYFWGSLGRGSSAETQVEAGQSSLDGFRQVAASIEQAAVIAPKVMTEAESDHAEIVKAYGEIRDTDMRSDGMASSSTTDTQEARAIQGMVQNVTGFGAMGTYEEVDEIAGGPVGSMSNERAKAAPVKPNPVAEVSDAAATGSQGEYTDTQARSDIMASVATMDTPEAQEAETGIVENIMDTGATGTVEEVDEIAGGPAPSLSADEAKVAPVTPTPAAPVAQTAKPDPVAEVSPDPVTVSHNTYNDTEARSDMMASVATMDTPEAQEAETGIVDNIMDTGATGTVEEVDEIAGGPAPSMSVDQARTAPASAQPDDLTVIEGIGFKMSAALKAAGIDTFARLTSTSEADLRAAIGAAGMRFAPSVPTWPHQASLAAKGDWSALKEYQQTLKAGRKK